MNFNDEVASELAQGFYDPLRFVLWAFPWGELPEFSLVELPEPWASRYPGVKYGPDRWMCELLEEVGEHVRKNNFDGRHSVEPLREAIASGHGIGKSAGTAMLVVWLLATRPGCKGVVTANTANQLETKTFAEIKKWLKRSLVADMFEVKSMSIEAKEAPESWRIDAITCREENSESFAGQHSASSSSFYIFDEASAVPDVIWEVAEGGLTDGEPFMFVFGNPTRNTGRFRECFGKRRARWKTKQIDSRDVAITNKKEIEAWREEYGEDSDFFRVRVRGLFPSASSQQFIPTGLAEAAALRDLPHNAATAAVIGVDVARFGDDDSVVYVRIGKGYLPIRRYHGLSTTELVSKVKGVFEEVRRIGFPRDRIYINVDEGGVGGFIGFYTEGKTSEEIDLYLDFIRFFLSPYGQSLFYKGLEENAGWPKALSVIDGAVFPESWDNFNTYSAGIEFNGLCANWFTDFLTGCANATGSEYSICKTALQNNIPGGAANVNTVSGVFDAQIRIYTAEEKLAQYVNECYKNYTQKPASK